MEMLSLPEELILLVVECMEDAGAALFAGTCKDAYSIVNYVFKKKCLKLSTEYRGWKTINVEDDLPWLKLYHEALVIRSRLLIAWSFHEYTNDTCQKVIDKSPYKCHGNRISTEITEGQFGKALRFSPSSGNPAVHGAQVLAMLNTAPTKEYTLSMWIRTSLNAASPLLSLLFAPKISAKEVQHTSLAFSLLHITSKGTLFFARLGGESTFALKADMWYHVIISSNSRTTQLYVFDDVAGEYVRVLDFAQSQPLLFEKLVVVLGNGKKGDFAVEEMSMLSTVLDPHAFWWMRHGFPFV